jgi:glycine cleavage system aminomethyltransferase T
MLVVNGSNREKDWAWVSRFAGDFGVELEDRTDDIALLALQGPRAQAILARLTDHDLDSIRYYRFAEGTVDGMPVIISRTGYTGEDGFELYVGADDAAALWRRLLEVGRRTGCFPPAWGAATRCGWRWGTRCTATTWTRSAPRWRPASPGSPSWTRVTSWGATRWRGRRRKG